MERLDWLDAGFDATQARFLMLTAITHHRFGARIWGESEVRKLAAELREIELTTRREVWPSQPDQAGGDPRRHELAGTP